MTLKSTIALTVCLPISMCLAACEAEYRVSNNSSKGDEDYFEEPISERSAKYAPALDTSNRFIEHFSAGNFDSVLELMDPRLRDVAPKENLEQMRETVFSNFGDLIEFKPMQWAFATHTEFDNVVISAKIVIHSETETFYVFKFEDDGKYDQLMGFNIWPRPADAPISQAFDRFFVTE